MFHDVSSCCMMFQQTDFQPPACAALDFHNCSLLAECNIAMPPPRASRPSRADMLMSGPVGGVAFPKSERCRKSLRSWPSFRMKFGERSTEMNKKTKCRLRMK